jgi:hypothetical protein
MPRHAGNEGVRLLFLLFCMLFCAVLQYVCYWVDDRGLHMSSIQHVYCLEHVLYVKNSPVCDFSFSPNQRTQPAQQDKGHSTAVLSRT